MATKYADMTITMMTINALVFRSVRNVFFLVDTTDIHEITLKHVSFNALLEVNARDFRVALEVTIVNVRERENHAVLEKILVTNAMYGFLFRILPDGLDWRRLCRSGRHLGLRKR